MSVSRVSIFGVLSALVVGLAMPVTAEAAALGNGKCEAGEFCLFREIKLSGPAMDFASGADALAYSPLQWPVVGGPVNDQATSARNRTNCAVRIYRHNRHSGPSQTIAAGEGVAIFGATLGDNTASSHNACV